MDGFTLVAVHIVDSDLADHITVVVVVARILPWLVSVVRVTRVAVLMVVLHLRLLVRILPQLADLLVQVAHNARARLVALSCRV